MLNHGFDLFKGGRVHNIHKGFRQSQMASRRYFVEFIHKRIASFAAADHPLQFAVGIKYVADLLPNNKKNGAAHNGYKDNQ